MAASPTNKSKPGAASAKAKAFVPTSVPNASEFSIADIQLWQRGSMLTGVPPIVDPSVDLVVMATVSPANNGMSINILKFVGGVWVQHTAFPIIATFNSTTGQYEATIAAATLSPLSGLDCILECTTPSASGGSALSQRTFKVS